jgi:hypothetical protein
MKISIVFIISVFAVNITVSQNKQSAFTDKSGHSEISLSVKDKNWFAKLNIAINERLKSGNISDTLFITFNEGVYPITETIQFKADLDNKQTPPIVIKGNEKVVFSGGTTLDNRKFYPITNLGTLNRIFNKEAHIKILEYDLKKGDINDLGGLKPIGFQREKSLAPAQLFYNEQRMTLARYPNEADMSVLKNRTSVIPIKKVINAGMKKVELPLDASKKIIGQDQNAEFEYSDPHVSKWANAKDVWVDGIFTRDWAWSLNKVKRIDTLKNSITLEYNEAYELTDKKMFFFACNLLEELDVPGEYYIDREEGKLYFYPPKDFNKNKSTIGLSNNPKDFIAIENCSNIKFENICFELGRNKAVDINQSENISFERCEFRNFGGDAITVNGQNNTISNSSIHSIGGTAISLSGGNFETLSKANNTVKDCKIYDWAYYNRVYTPAIALSGVGNNVIHNTLYHAPHGAITIGGNDHVIAKNEIYDVLFEFIDFGAIYGFLGKNQLQRGHVIKGNYFHDIGKIGDKVFVVYADEATAGWLVEDNIFYKIGSKGTRLPSVFGNTPSYMKVKHNLFLDCSQTLEISFHFSTWGKKKYDEYFALRWKEQYNEEGSIPAVYTNRYPELKTFMSEERIYVNTNSFTDNTIGNFSIPLNHTGYFKAWSNLPNSDHLIISTNNTITRDISLPNFLDSWNNATSEKRLKMAIPEGLIQYGYFKK